MERRRLAKKFFLLAGVVSVLVLCVYLAWSYHTQSIENGRRALAEARVLSAEIGLPGTISMPSSRRSIARRAKPRGSIAQWRPRISPSVSLSGSAYSIRYIRESPRNTEDALIASSARRLPSSRRASVEEYYGLSIKEIGSVFRYVGLLEVEEGCLPCHGDPAGEEDVTGYAKEGMTEGDVAGAVSIVMPMDSIIADAKATWPVPWCFSACSWDRLR